MRNLGIYCLSTVISPLTHMAGTDGNTAMLMREPVHTAGGVRYVPCLSGNAIRHRMVREPGARYLVEALGLDGRLTRDLAAFMFNGGKLTASTGREATAEIVEMQRLFPLLALLGGSLPNQIIAGRLIVWRGTLVCHENVERLAGSLPGPLPDGILPGAEHYVCDYQYTRSDQGLREPELVDASSPEDRDGSALMIYSGQAVVAGAVFDHGFLIEAPTPERIGALLLSLRLWQEAGGTIGGMAGRGHGRLAMRAALSAEIDAESCIGAYMAHVRDTAAEARAWLWRHFPPAKKPIDPPVDVGGVRV